MDPFNLQDWPKSLSAGLPNEISMVDQIVIDSRRVNSKHALFVALPGHESDGHHFVLNAFDKGAKYALVKKTFYLPQQEGKILLKVEDPLQALQEITAAYRMQLKCKIIAVAGSYGKTMAKDLLHALLATTFKTGSSPESFNSQIGVPLSLLTLTKNEELAIIETAISKPSEMENLSKMVQPDFGLVTTIGKKHLATLGTLENAVSETLSLFYDKERLEWVLLPKESAIDPFLSKIKAAIHFWNLFEKSLPFASSEKNHGLNLPYTIRFPNSEPFLGQIRGGYSYFLDLVNVSVKAAWKLGVAKENIHAVMENYFLEPMRTEIWQSNSALFINDSYSSDPQSVDQACRLLKTCAKAGKKVFLFGGLRGEKSPKDYRRIAEGVAKEGVDHIGIYGTNSFDSLIAEIQETSPKTTIFSAKSFPEALEHLKSWLQSGDTVLIKGAQKEPFEKILNAFHECSLTNLCSINLAAIENNIKILTHKLKNTRLMVMVKALSYGTGGLRVAKFLERCGIDILGVSYVDEAIALLREGAEQSFFVLNASDYEISKVIKWNLEVGVSDAQFVSQLGKASELARKKIKVHLHIDTGMCRFGVRPENALELAQMIKKHPYLQLEGIMTHFVCSDTKEEDAFTLQQAKVFDQVIACLESKGFHFNWKHAANSGAALRFNFPQYNMARIGLAAYGLYPSQHAEETLDLRLAISLTSRVAGINICRKGETISYGRSYKVERDFQKIAVLPIGYFDGLHRNYSGRAHVLIRGQKAPMVGKICMDFMMVDVTDIPDIAIGDAALIFGEDEYGNYLSPEELALSGNSIIHELITCLGPRIQRIFVLEESKQYR